MCVIVCDGVIVCQYFQLCSLCAVIEPRGSRESEKLDKVARDVRYTVKHWLSMVMLEIMNSDDLLTTIIIIITGRKCQLLFPLVHSYLCTIIATLKFCHMER